NSGALAVAQAANTSAVGLSARAGFGSGWVTTVSYSEGVTQLDLRANSIAIAKHGLFADNDSLGLEQSELGDGDTVRAASPSTDCSRTMTVSASRSAV